MLKFMYGLDTNNKSIAQLINKNKTLTHGVLVLADALEAVELLVAPIAEASLEDPLGTLLDPPLVDQRLPDVVGALLRLDLGLDMPDDVVLRDVHASGLARQGERHEDGLRGVLFLQPIHIIKHTGSNDRNTQQLNINIQNKMKPHLEHRGAAAGGHVAATEGHVRRHRRR